MAIYICIKCGHHCDNDYYPCEEYGDNALICPTCKEDEENEREEEDE